MVKMKSEFLITYSKLSRQQLVEEGGLLWLFYNNLYIWSVLALTIHILCNELDDPICI